MGKLLGDGRRSQGANKAGITQQEARDAKVPSSVTTLAGTARGLVPTRVAPGGHVPAPPAHPSPHPVRINGPTFSKEWRITGITKESRLLRPN